jgi:hypothetical protein
MLKDILCNQKHKVEFWRTVHFVQHSMRSHSSLLLSAFWLCGYSLDENDTTVGKYSLLRIFTQQKMLAQLETGLFAGFTRTESLRQAATIGRRPSWSYTRELPCVGYGRRESTI